MHPDVRDILRGLGVPPNQYAGHSFRIRAATMAALVGLENSDLGEVAQCHLFFRYITTPEARLVGLSARGKERYLTIHTLDCN